MPDAIAELGTQEDLIGDLASDLGALDELIAELESAPRGNHALDIKIEYCLGIALGGRVDVAHLLVEEGVSWDTVSETLADRVPPYTTSLDAAIEGENILFVIRSDKRRRWGATHKWSKGRECLAWGRTEALARRLAALKGWHTDKLAGLEHRARRAVRWDAESAADDRLREDDDVAQAAPAAAPAAPAPAAPDEWKIRF